MSIFIDPVNAFTQLMSPLSETPLGPLKGLQFAVKDVFDVKDFRVQAGNPDYFNQAPLANATAPAVTLLQNAGAQLVGKTHTDELGGSLFGLNHHFGSPLNSHSPERVPGGSSSGSAAAVSANLVDFALGADTSGSVRAPASFCGIYGFRPTFGNIETTGVLPISGYLDTVGILARHPDMISRVLQVYGIKKENTFTRLRTIPTLENVLQKPLNDNFLKKLNEIQRLTLNTHPLSIEEDQLTQWSMVIRTIAMYGLWQVHKEWILKTNPTFGVLIKERLKMASTISSEDYQLSLKKQKDIKKFMEDSLRPGDIAVFPTIHDIPPFLSSTMSQLKDFALKASRHTCIAALAGFPEITVPIRNIEQNCFLGMSFLGRADEDYSLSVFASKVHAILNEETIKRAVQRQGY